MLENLRDFFTSLRDDAESWCVGRSPWARAALTLYLFYACVCHIRDPLYRSWFAGITLAFHELGHVIFAPFGRTMMLAGGSITQLLVPSIAAIYLLLGQRDWFGLSVGTFWLSFSTFELATYVDDANQEQLPLVSLGGQPEHDWSTLLTEWHCLNSAQTFAGVLRGLAVFESLAAGALAIWLIARMVRESRTT